MDVERPIDRWTYVAIDPSKLTQARETAGHTQSSLARAAGVSQSTVNNAERGVKKPSLPTARALARALNVTLDQIKANGDQS